MAYSYLNTHLCIPIDATQLEQALSAQVTLPSTLLQSLDNALTPLREPSDALMYFPDGPWLDVHLKYLTQLTYWEVLLLRAQNVRSNSVIVPAVKQRRDHLLLTAHEISYIAFAYTDAALAEHLSRLLLQDESGLFIFAPTGEKDERCVLLSRSSIAPIIKAKMPADRHPILQWLSSPPFELTRDLPTWPALAQRQAEQAAQENPLLAQWRKFVAAQTTLTRGAVGGPQERKYLSLGSSHFTDGKQVFFGNVGELEDAVVLEDCDLSTFREHADGEVVGHYATDAKRLWSWGRSLPCAAPDQFGPCAWDGSIYTDGAHLYIDDAVLEDVDARTIRVVFDPSDGENASRAEGFIHDDTFYWSLGGWCSTKVDGPTFRAVGHRYYIDAQHVYHRNDTELTCVEGFDPATFRLVDHHNFRYLLDGEQVALERDNGKQPVRLKGANAATFRVLPQLPFAVDSKRVWLGHKPCKDLDAATLTMPRKHSLFPADPSWDINRYFVSRDVVYMWRNSYEDYAPLAADTASFELLDVPFARDAEHIWYWGQPIDASAAGFRWLNQSLRLWTDGQRVFVGNESRPDCWLAAVTQGQLEEIQHGLVRADNCFYLYAAEIQGWHRETHRLSPFDCIEDDNHYYSLTSHSQTPIAVWTKHITTRALATYELDSERHSCFCNHDLSSLAEADSPPLLTREEFDTLLNCLPPEMALQMVITSFSDPEVTMTRMFGGVDFVRLEGNAHCTCTLEGDQLIDTLSPANTVVAYRAAREQLERALAITPALTFSQLQQLELRIPLDQTSTWFDFDGCLLLIQNGDDNLRGIWLDERLSDETIERAAIFVAESGCFDSWYAQGPSAAYGAVDDEQLVVSGWNAERRTRFRTHIANFLADVPPARKPSRQSNTKRRNQ